jgi:ribonucleotide reductase beta subunit family protein with ferritin-like domain
MAVLEQQALVSYEELFRRWESAQWSATRIDLTQDAHDWAALSDGQRASFRWLLGMFLLGEDAVASDLSPYVIAAPSEDQRYFLATQQADEAHHSVFFARYAREVLGDGDSTSTVVAASRGSGNPAYRLLFRRLRSASQRLEQEPSDPVAFAEAVTMYHLVIEAVLGVSGQYYLELATERLDALPGLREGVENVARDEHRHVAFGVLALNDAFRTHPETHAAVGATLRSVLPYTAAVFRPSRGEPDHAAELGFTNDEIAEFGLRSLRGRIRTAGLDLDAVMGEGAEGRAA